VSMVEEGGQLIVESFHLPIDLPTFLHHGHQFIGLRHE
jgi:hypothetical protein